MGWGQWRGALCCVLFLGVEGGLCFDFLAVVFLVVVLRLDCFLSFVFLFAVVVAAVAIVVVVMVVVYFQGQVVFQLACPVLVTMSSY